jgi:hypothetical protein
MIMHYNKWRGLFYQIRKDNTPFKKDLFGVYLRQNPFLYYCYRLIRSIQTWFFVPLFGYVFYFYARFFISFPKQHAYLTMIKMKSEKQSFLNSFLNNNEHIGIIRKTKLPSISQILYIFTSTSISWKKVYRMLKQYELFIVLRAIQYLAYYDRFMQEINSRVTKGVIVFTDANPHGRALIQVAYAKEILLTFITHGAVNEPILPLRCECLYVLGKRSYERLLIPYSHFKHVVFQGHKHLKKNMRAIDFANPLVVGMFLSKSTQVSKVLKCISIVSNRYVCKKIMVRMHPNRPLSKAERMYLAKNELVLICGESKIEEDIESCDLIIAGNSTSHLDVLLQGRVSLYYRGLEESEYDRYGYVKEGLVLDWDENVPDDYVQEQYADIKINTQLNYYLNIEKTREESNQELYEVIFK